MKRIFTILLCAALLISSVAFTAFAEERTEAAQNVVEMIMGLDGNTKPEDLVAIKNAYDALSPEEKETVFNYDAFIAFEKTELVPALNKLIEEMPDVKLIDIYHFEKDVNDAYARYSALTDEAKEAIVDGDKLIAAKERIDSLYEFNANKKVILLSSTMKGLSDYTFESIKEASKKDAIGIYYYFDEVDLIERGDSTTGYYHPNNLDKIVLFKYAKLEMDVKWTDIDVINGWPMPFQVTITNGGNGWSGYDFVNGGFFQGDVSNMDHGRLAKIKSFREYELTYGVWHHLEVLHDGESLTYTIDGEVVFETEIDGIYDLYIIYPWLCNLEMTNVKIVEKDGSELLSPFRNYVANPNWTGWTRSSNEEGKTMLDCIEESLAETRKNYEKLSEDEKAQIVGAEQIDRVQALIDTVRSGKYPLTVVGGSADKSELAFNEKVTVTADAAPEGKVFDKWVVEPEMTLLAQVDPEEVPADLTASTLTFAMPDTILTLTATYKDRPPFTLGDANDDGKINAKDVTAIMKFLVGAAPKTFVEAAADYDSNGKVNAKDVTKLMKDLVSAK